MADLMEQNHWHYFDFWNAIEPSDFSNTAVHLTPAGSQKLSSLVMNAILETVQDKTE
jgi:hypothetical protein